MAATKSRKAIFKLVQRALVEALNCDDDEVVLTARIQADLGAESIDFLDIIFRLERDFNIKIPRNELFTESVSFQEDAGYIHEGKFTTKGTQELRKIWHWAAIPDNLEANELPSLFTVEWILLYLEHRLTPACR